MRPGTRESSLAVAVASLDWMWIEERRGGCGGGLSGDGEKDGSRRDESGGGGLSGER